MVIFTPRIYPEINIVHIKHPNRFYAFPFLGGVVKIFMLIPIFFWLFLLGIASFVMTFINSFIVLFSGKYWKPAFEINSLIIIISVKASYFFLGLTNNYPGFDSKIKDFSLQLTFPKNPNRWLAFPVLGGIFRIILAIPYFIYSSIMQNAGSFASIVASFPVLFMEKYPESLYELCRDSIRVNISLLAYFTGISDNYPSFWISMKHRGIKILFIILATLIFLSNKLSGFQKSPNNYQPYHYSYPSQTPSY